MADEHDDSVDELLRLFDQDPVSHEASLIEALALASAQKWLQAAASVNTLVRCAAAAAAIGRDEHDVLIYLPQLLTDPSPLVRKAVLNGPGVGGLLPAATIASALGEESWEIRVAAVRAGGAVGSMDHQLREVMRQDEDEDVRRAAAEELAGRADEATLLEICQLIKHETGDHWELEGVVRVLVERLDSAGPGFISRNRPFLVGFKDAVEADWPQGHPFRRWLANNIGPTRCNKALRDVGEDLVAAVAAGRIPRAHLLDKQVASLRRLVTSQTGSRSAVIIGASGVGKSALIGELVNDLVHEGWQAVRIIAQDLVAGAQYLGTWQKTVGELIDAASRHPNTLVHIEGLHDLNSLGVTGSSPAAVLDMLAPHIERGAIAVIGSASPEDWRAGVGGEPGLATLFSQVTLEPASVDETLQVLERVAQEMLGEIGQEDRELLGHVVELSDQFIVGQERPGRAVYLLRRFLERTGPGPADRLLLEVLSETVSIPIDLLDDRTPLDLDRVRRELADQVIGQDLAVGAVVDVITLIKAGLQDPGRPSAVLFFVGPTGVGKTELARALAGYLFGDANRLLRLDMSEYATADSYLRLIGGPRGGALTEPVRSQPFTVVLLDEIEKAHPKVFDLLLQVFDAGRLTTLDGRVVDFRSSIIIATSNIGAAIPTAAVGFGESPGHPGQTDIERALQRHFRPEFLGRLDRVVTFDPLSRDVVERIARREIAVVIERSGVRRRKIFVDVDPAVVSVVVDKGYSAAFGARPLKGVVRDLVLLPLARSLARAHLEPGALLRLVGDGDRVVLRTISTTEPVTEHTRVVSSVAHVQARLDRLADQARPLAARRQELLLDQSAPEFWDDRDKVALTLDEIFRLDRVLGDLERVRAGLERTASNPDPRRQATFLESHVVDVDRLERILHSGDLGDAYVIIRLVSSYGEPLDSVSLLANMYIQFADRERLGVEVVDDRLATSPAVDTVTLLVTGAGAHCDLSAESGIHEFRRPAGTTTRNSTEIARVEVLPVPFVGGDRVPATVKASWTRLSSVDSHFDRAPTHQLRLTETEGSRTIVVWASGPPDDILDRTVPLLLIPPGSSADQGMVRSYDFGPPLVRDRRAGVTTGRLGDVLQGRLHLFLG